MKKRVVHFEIGCSDVEKTSAFYEKVFNWNLSLQGNYASIDMGDENALKGHMNQLGPNDPQNYVTLYIETDSLIADLKAIVANGGQIFVNPKTLPDGRVFAWFKDITGNLMGLITPN